MHVACEKKNNYGAIYMILSSILDEQFPISISSNTPNLMSIENSKAPNIHLSQTAQVQRISNEYLSSLRDGSAFPHVYQRNTMDSTTPIRYPVINSLRYALPVHDCKNTMQIPFNLHLQNVWMQQLGLSTPTIIYLNGDDSSKPLPKNYSSDILRHENWVDTSAIVHPSSSSSSAAAVAPTYAGIKKQKLKQATSQRGKTTRIKLQDCNITTDNGTLSNSRSSNESQDTSNFIDSTSVATSQELYATSCDIPSNHLCHSELSLYMMQMDETNLSPYQCLLRMQVEYFEAGVDDVQSTMQGRNKPICLGQVGVRCRFCSQRAPQHRTRGSTYYPTTLEGIYQACQNMASIHLSQNCPLIPESLRKELVKLRLSKSSTGGGKHYWAETAKSKGIIESNGILILLKEKSSDIEI
jgi:hypothetical protein